MGGASDAESSPAVAAIATLIGKDGEICVANLVDPRPLFCSICLFKVFRSVEKLAL